MNWRQILGWQPDNIKVGDRVKLKGSYEELWLVCLEGEDTSPTFTVEKVSPDESYPFVTRPERKGVHFTGEITIVGRGGSPVFYLPYSHWETYLEVIR